MTPSLQRRLGTADAVFIGLGSMIGAGIFVALGPAAAAAGSGLLVGLAVAALVAYCNATSSARLAARYPESGGTYVLRPRAPGRVLGISGRLELRRRQNGVVRSDGAHRRLYLWPAGAHAIAVVAVLALTAVNLRGIQKSALLSRVIVAVVLAALTAVVVAVAFLRPRRPTRSR